ncbi:hypothetical protein NM688_g6198 [Phlebia brevispora]|uniref:Uncharacterized protein n=1 Tax=Phlebia brevispora TaxID=194682 RepID=A0ACC1SIR6_9APHY|nr:hypothetical protein NM688_g6198 [Phlebia brevispora]
MLLEIWMTQIYLMSEYVNATADSEAAYLMQSNAVAAVIAPAGKVFIMWFVPCADIAWYSVYALNFVSLLFLVNRYATLCKMILLFQTNWAGAVFLGLTFYNIFDCLGLFVVAVFNPLRVWGLGYQQHRYFVPLFLFSLFTPLYNAFRVSQATYDRVSKFPPPVGGCLIQLGIPPSIWSRQVPPVHLFHSMLTFRLTDRALSVLIDAVVLALTWKKSYSTYKAAVNVRIKPIITRILLLDGTMYFGTLLIINAIMLATNRLFSTYFPFSPGSFASLSTEVVELRLIWVTSFTSILLSRFILDLRGACQCHIESDPSQANYPADMELVDLESTTAGRNLRHIGGEA